MDTRPALSPLSLRCLSPRRPGVQYFVEHAGSHVYVLTNAALGNFVGGAAAYLNAGTCAEYRLLQLPKGPDCRWGNRALRHYAALSFKLDQSLIHDDTRFIDSIVVEMCLRQGQPVRHCTSVCSLNSGPISRALGP